jgi:hypothetical protein
MALVYNDKSGKYRAGMQIWDRPDISLATLIARREEISKMPDGDAKDATLKKYAVDSASPTRMYVGKNAESDSTIELSDAKGTVRLRMIVAASGNPRLEFLDESGKVTKSFGEK